MKAPLSQPDADPSSFISAESHPNMAHLKASAECGSAESLNQHSSWRSALFELRSEVLQQQQDMASKLREAIEHSMAEVLQQQQDTASKLREAFEHSVAEVRQGVRAEITAAVQEELEKMPVRQGVGAEIIAAVQEEFEKMPVSEALEHRFLELSTQAKAYTDETLLTTQDKVSQLVSRCADLVNQCASHAREARHYAGGRSATPSDGGVSLADRVVKLEQLLQSQEAEETTPSGARSVEADMRASKPQDGRYHEEHLQIQSRVHTLERSVAALSQQGSPKRSPREGSPVRSPRADLPTFTPKQSAVTRKQMPSVQQVIAPQAGNQQVASDTQAPTSAGGTAGIAMGAAVHRATPSAPPVLLGSPITVGMPARSGAGSPGLPVATQPLAASPQRVVCTGSALRSRSPTMPLRDLASLNRNRRNSLGAGDYYSIAAAASAVSGSCTVPIPSVMPSGGQGGEMAATQAGVATQIKSILVSGRLAGCAVGQLSPRVPA